MSNSWTVMYIAKGTDSQKVLIRGEMITFRFGLVAFSNHTAIIARRAMMAAKFLNFEVFWNAYVDRQKQNLHNKESF